jgi:hypothetical protein
MLDWNLSKYRIKTTSSVVLYFAVLIFRPLDMVKPNVSFKNVINGRFLSSAKLILESPLNIIGTSSNFSPNLFASIAEPSFV